MSKLNVPSDSDGLKEVLSDPSRLQDYFSEKAVRNGDTKRFLDTYAGDYVKQNPDAVTEVRDQVQSVLFDMVRSGGDKGNSKLGAPANGPLDAEGTAAVSQGRGNVYYKTAMGAKLEQAFTKE